MPDSRWIRLGGVAGILWVLIAVIGAALTGAPPQADGKAITYQNYFIEKQDLLVAQGWMYGLSVPLLLMFAVSVRRILRESDEGGYLSELFLIGQTAIATLLVVGMAMQIAVAQAADQLAAAVVYTFGDHFGAVMIGLWGFIIGVTAFAYAYSVFAHGVLPRWTAWLAVVAIVVSLFSTAGVFIGAGAFSPEGGVSAWAPAASTMLWYLGTSIAILRRRGEWPPSRSTG